MNGLGKTVISLSVLDELLYNRFDAGKVLVVSTIKIIKDTWPEEIKKWDHLRHLDMALVLGSEKERIKALSRKADIYGINRENVVWLVEHYGKNWPFDTVVIDELSSFKNSKAKRFRALKRVRPLFKRIAGLTGTPAPRSYEDLWSQVYLLDQGERLGKTKSEYLKKYFFPKSSSGHIVYEWILKPGAKEEIDRKISDICISMSAKDWLDLPERINNIVKVKLSDEAKVKYDQLKRELLLPYADANVVASTAAVLSNKLLQMANGAIYDELGGVKHIHDAKLEALDEIIELSAGKPVLASYFYKHDLARLKKRYPQGRELLTSEDKAAWDKGDIPLLFLHPMSAGHGLNLQTGGSIIVWFSMTWDFELYDQLNARLDRQGQIENVILHHLIAEGTIDERAFKALQTRGDAQQSLKDAVKADIEEVKSFDSKTRRG